MTTGQKRSPLSNFVAFVGWIAAPLIFAAPFLLLSAIGCEPLGDGQRDCDVTYSPWGTESVGNDC